jgi:hypothetical protein
VVVADDDVHRAVIQQPPNDVVLVLPERVAPLREALLDVAAHAAVCHDRDVLNDRVAMRELALRLREAQVTLNQLIEARLWCWLWTVVRGRAARRCARPSAI